MTSNYYVYGKYRELGNPPKEIIFTIKYNNKITLDLINDFQYYCRDYIRKNHPQIINFQVYSWSRIDE